MRKTYTVGIVVSATLVGAGLAALPAAASGAPSPFGSVGSANPRSGVQDDVLAPGLRQTSVAWGALKVTNPDAANGVTHYGYNTSNGGPLTQDPHEAFKTEPDKNVYLVLGGHHYLFQGHEGGPRGYVTRVDLDQADQTQRVSLVTDVDTDGNALPDFDGITWDPFSGQLLLTAESASPVGGVWAVALDANGNPTTGKAVRLPLIGSGGFEGVQNDSDGNVWIVEDIGGPTVAGTNGKKPNSYLYRFVPVDKTDLTKGGTLQALQVQRADGTAVTAAQLSANPSDPFIGALHTYGASFATRWVTVHEGSAAPFGATAAAAAAGATPFKRPENGVFRPGTGFGEFYFTETGRHERTDHAARRVRRRLQAGPDGPEREHRDAVPGLARRRRAHRLRQHLLRGPRRAPRRRGRRRRSAHPARRPRLRLRGRAPAVATTRRPPPSLAGSRKVATPRPRTTRRPAPATTTGTTR